ncbi:uncharacterized protein LOC111054894 [Nilaparvata lugens]|uniref:uncharacterized protein LOC111054894 n=1 Tax=Nilaparvata lugens TaxID=108931 RepID=UPI00193E7266|nr:uncharacterized protein LOC111054894 [Nilaparvata lugens]
MKSVSVIALLCLVQGYAIISTKGDVLFDTLELSKESSPELDHDEIGSLDPSLSLPDSPFSPDTEDDLQLMLADEGVENNVVDIPIVSPSVDVVEIEETTVVSSTSTESTSQPETTTEVHWTTKIVAPSSTTTTEPVQENVERDEPESTTTSTTATTTIQENDENEETDSTTTEYSTTPDVSTTPEASITTTEDTVQIAIEETERRNKELALRKVNKLSDQIRLVLQQYKKTKTVKILDVPIPDPMSIPEITTRYSSLGTINFKNMVVYGLSNFTVKHINTDLEKMQVYVMLKIDRLVTIGNYSMRTWFSRAAGPCTTIMYNVTAESAAALQRNEDGDLEASESEMDMTFEDVKLDFKNLGMMGAVFQGAMGSVASLMFDGMKPAILGEVNTKLRSDVNKKLKTMAASLKLADMNPVDQAVMEGRRYVQDQGYDPYFLKNFTRDFGLITVNVTNFYLRGLSRFYRVGEIPFSMDSGVVEAGLHVATNRLNGSCIWSVGIGHTVIRNGSLDFSTEQLQIRGVVRQSLDLEEQPKLHDLDILLGRLELKTARIDSLDYFVETAVNNLPSLLRHIIVDGLEDPIKFKVQQILDEVDVQAIVNETLPAIDKFGV